MYPNMEALGVVLEVEDVVALQLAHDVTRSCINMEHIPDQLKGTQLHLPEAATDGTVAIDDRMARNLQYEASLAVKAAMNNYTRTKEDHDRMHETAGTEDDEFLSFMRGEMSTEQAHARLFRYLGTGLKECLDASAEHHAQQATPTTP